MKPRKLVGAAVLSIALAAGIVTPAVASDGRCDSVDVCLYMHNNQTGPKRDTSSNYSNYQDYAYYGNPIGLNDSVTSFGNYDPKWGITFFTDAGYSGWSQWSSPYVLNEAWYNDQYSSHAWD
ncbi:peptidase inhibitor family I36 protein [Streptomyces sp. NPDC054961]